MNIPQNYLPVMPYLILKESKAFMDFTKIVFGAKEQLIVPGEKDTIMHGELKIHDAVIMFAQAGKTWTEKTAGMYIYVTDVNNVYQKALENGATALMAPEKKEYGYSGGFEDPFGNHWWIVEG
ncbi:MAG: VOC family protein [Sporocytophaga sp.]|nr:VOC family protein [Sporocytophaga sp.]